MLPISSAASAALSAASGRGNAGGPGAPGPAAASPPARAEDGRGPSQAGAADNGQAGGARKGRFDVNECQTCNNRRYQDGSDDAGVSFKTPTKVDPRTAASAVRGHEMEHVFREQAKARREGREVVSQSVVYHTGICPECGRTYVAGGTTRTVTKAKGRELKELFDVGRQQPGVPQLDRTA